MDLDMALDMEEYPKVEDYRLNLSVSAFPAKAVQIRTRPLSLSVDW